MIKGALRIAGPYFAFSILWIITSDKIVLVVSPYAESFMFYSTIKGVIFVALTSLFIFYLSLRELNRRNRLIERLNNELKVKKDLIAELHHRILNNLQVVISLFSNETDSDKFPQKIRSRLISRLFSLKSVFSIVYYKMDINQINLCDALKEYATFRSERVNIAQNIAIKSIILPIEQTVSIMIAVDIITYRFNDDDKVLIEISDNNLLSITGKLDYEIQPLSDKDTELLSMLLKSSSCKLSSEIRRITITIVNSNNN